MRFPGATSDDVVVQAGEAVDASGVSVATSVLEEGDSTFGETLCTTVGYDNGNASGDVCSATVGCTPHRCLWCGGRVGRP